MNKRLSQAVVPTVHHRVDNNHLFSVIVIPMIFANFSLIKDSSTLMIVPMLFHFAFIPPLQPESYNCLPIRKVLRVT